MRKCTCLSCTNLIKSHGQARVKDLKGLLVSDKMPRYYIKSCYIPQRLEMRHAQTRSNACSQNQPKCHISHSVSHNANSSSLLLLNFLHVLNKHFLMHKASELSFPHHTDVPQAELDKALKHEIHGTAHVQ